MGESGSPLIKYDYMKKAARNKKSRGSKSPKRGFNLKEGQYLAVFMSRKGSSNYAKS